MSTGVFILQVLIALLTMMLMISTHRSVKKKRENWKKTLEWYANEDHYDHAPDISDLSKWEPPAIFHDRGERARRFLEGGETIEDYSS